MPGCITTGTSVEETVRHMREAIAGRLEVMAEARLAIPNPGSLMDAVDVALPVGLK